MDSISLRVLELAGQGDIEAFEEVYKTTAGFVYNVALRIIRNSADAQEVTQDVFMKIYRGLKDFAFRSSFKTWVYRITVNTAINYYHSLSRKEKGRVDYESAVESLPDGRSPVDELSRSEDQAKLNRLLGKINIEYRTVLVLREIEGLSYQEIAGALKIPVNTVRSRLSRGRQALMDLGGKE
jgi:RNA polymerase sigma-70 factor, ECF subfamily